MAIKHAFVSEKQDGADETLVRPSDWNADHDVDLEDADIPATIARDTEVTAAIAALNIPTVVHKTADEIVNNSSTLQNDDHLFFAVGANEVWEFYLYCMYVMEAGSARDIKGAFTVPAGGALWKNLAFGADGTAMVDGTASVSMMPLTTSIKYVQMRYLYVGGASAGNIQFQWAQSVAEAKNYTLKQNSFILANKLA